MKQGQKRPQICIKWGTFREREREGERESERMRSREKEQQTINKIEIDTPLREVKQVNQACSFQTKMHQWDKKASRQSLKVNRLISRGLQMQT